MDLVYDAMQYFFLNSVLSLKLVPCLVEGAEYQASNQFDFSVGVLRQLQMVLV